jgi:hypothetical protein
MGDLIAKVTKPQGHFLAQHQRFRAFVTGYGGGKTWVGCIAQCINAWRFPGMNQGYFAPTYPQIRDIYYPSMEEVAYNMGLHADIKESNKEVHLYSGRQYRSTIICRSMERPHTIIGFRIAHALIDELDVMPIDKARIAWRKILARMRYPDGANTVDVTTTPEGFRFTHEQFVKELQNNPERKARYALIQGSTYDNEKNLPADYIPSLVEAYPKELIAAYINGQFVNLTSGTVYRNYDRQAHDSKEQIKKNETLYIGMDFNVGKMAASVFVERANGYHAVAELKDMFDTPDMAQLIKERWQDKGHRIIVYPDASGGSRKSVDASRSDLAILRQFGFTVRAKKKNPPVKDRVAAVNKAFEDGKLWINVQACPTIADCLEQQAYDKNGEPDKTSGHDHQNDATSYFAFYEMPVNKPVFATGIRSAM